MTPHRPLRIEQSPLERARLWVEILAFFAAGCWALYTFVYQTKIAPAYLPAHEIVSANVQRLTTTPSVYLERVQVTLENDGPVDVDTAAIAISVLGLRPAGTGALSDIHGRYDDFYRALPLTAWRPLESHGMLFDAAVRGKRGRHYLLRSGDKASLDDIAVIPRSYIALQVHVETIFGRYPIEPRLAVALLSKHGEVRLQNAGSSIKFSSFFPV